MFRKECMDTAKSLGLAFISSFITIVIAFFIGKQAGYMNDIQFSDVLYTIIEVIFLLIAVFLGSGIFGEEKKLGSFEYLFSLKYSRLKLLGNKLSPRLIALGIILIIYLGIMGIAGDLLLMNSALFIPLLFSIFFFFVSLSLLHENNSLNTIFNLIGLMISLATIYLIVDVYTNLFVLYNKVPDSEIRVFAANIFTFLSICLFIVFVFSFKKIDLATLNFKFMKKNLLRLVIIIGGLLSFFVLINQFDSKLDPKTFTEKDLLPASFSVDNGFYLFLTLFEPADVDIRSEKIVQKYRSFFDPKFKKEKNVKMWNFQAFEKLKRPFLKIIQKHFKTDKSNWVRSLNLQINKYSSNFILSKKDSILKLSTELAPLLKRYRLLINSSSYDVFLAPVDKNPLWRYLLLTMKISTINAFKNSLDCLEGNWAQGMSSLINNLNFYKKVFRGSRDISNIIMAKNNMQTNLYIIAFLMNHPKCPKEVYRQIYEGMPDLTYEDFGSKNALVSVYLTFLDFMQNGVKEKIGNGLKYFGYKLFLQENKTRNYLYKLTKDLIMFEQKQPYQSQDLKEKISKGTKFNQILWWVQNSSGKKIIKKNWFPSVLWRNSYFIKALYDMTKISAELRLKIRKDDNISDTLKTLNSYKTLKDPYSGKSYKYNSKEKVIYSVGLNLIDDKGKHKTQGKKDIILPLSFKKE